MNLDKSIYSEANISKKPALELLQAMGYTYLSPEECRQQRGSGYRVLLRDVLRGQLRKLNRYTYGGVENEFSAVNIEQLIADEVKRLSTQFGKSFLDCENLIELTGLGRDNVRALMHSKAFPVTKVGNRQVVSILAFVAWQVNSLPEAV